MLNIENDIALIHLKKKKDEISEIKKSIENYQKLSSFWLTLCARLIVRGNRSIKTMLAKINYQTESLSITEVEKMISRDNPIDFIAKVVTLEQDQMLLYDHVNSKKPSLKVKYKAIKDLVGNQTSHYLK